MKDRLAGTLHFLEDQLGVEPFGRTGERDVFDHDR